MALPEPCLKSRRKLCDLPTRCSDLSSAEWPGWFFCKSALQRITTRHAMWRERIMKTNKFWTVLSKALAVIAATLIMALVLAPGASAATTEKVLYSFTGGSDGSQPREGLVFDQAGNLYGATLEGGAYGYGTVFQLTPNSDGSWTESVLYSFTGGSDGAGPNWAGRF